MDSINLDLDLRDVSVILVALHDAKSDEGGPAWDHPNVRRLRAKLARAIAAAIEPEADPVIFGHYLTLNSAAKAILELREGGTRAMLAFTYRDRAGNETERCVHPTRVVELYQGRGAPRVIAFDPARDAPRAFYAGRAQRVRVVPAPMNEG